MKTEIEKRKEDIKLVKDNQANVKADTILKNAQTSLTGVQGEESFQRTKTDMARNQQIQQTADREKIVGPGNPANLQTWVPAAQKALDTMSKPSVAQPSSAHGSITGGRGMWSGTVPNSARDLRNKLQEQYGDSK